FPPLLRARDFTVQQLSIFPNRVQDLRRRLIHKLDPEMARSQLSHPPDVFCSSLGPSIEDGVAAAGVGLERVFGADAISQFHVMSITGTSTVGVICAPGKKGAKDTMLHMKHRHVLVDGNFKPIRVRGAEER